MLYYWFTFQWAGWNPAVWHVTGLLIHAANTLLLYIFLNRVFSLTIPALAGSLLFAWHASHVEAICWTAASFDLLAAFFSLLTLLQATDFRAKRFQTATIMLTAVFACLSKESAYCLPLIVADLPGSTEAHNAAACF